MAHAVPCVLASPLGPIAHAVPCVLASPLGPMSHAVPCVLGLTGDSKENQHSQLLGAGHYHFSMKKGRVIKKCKMWSFTKWGGGGSPKTKPLLIKIFFF